MAARINAKHDELTRSKIQTSQLINRLMDHVNSDTDLLSTSQVNAAKALLAKTLPDLAAVQISGDADNPVKMTIEWTNSNPSA